MDDIGNSKTKSNDSNKESSEQQAPTKMGKLTQETKEMVEDAVKVQDLDFSYDNPYGDDIVALTGVNFTLPRGSKTLLIAANGAGKSTLLRILAGKHLHKKEQITVLGQPAFYQTLGVSGISYLGNQWTRTVAFAGNNVAYQADIPVKDMMKHLQEEYPERRDELYEIFEIDPEWRMHQVSDGQRRRVQMMLGLLRPFQLLLLDEVTVDLDVEARAQFMDYLSKECKERGATVIYVTHIFDGMDDWPTNVIMLDSGKIVECLEIEQLRAKPDFTSLYKYVLNFLKDQKKKRLEAEKKVTPEEKAKRNKDPMANTSGELPNCGFTSGRMLHYMNFNSN